MVKKPLSNYGMHSRPFSSNRYASTIPVLKVGHPGVLVIVCFVFVYIVWCGCIGSGFSSYLASSSVLYTCV